MKTRKIALIALITVALGCAKEPIQKYKASDRLPVPEFNKQLPAEWYYQKWKAAEDMLDLCELSIQEVINDCTDAVEKF